MYLDSNQIAQILPQAYPFLMLDRVVDFKKGESLTAIKNITGNEWIFEGHRRPPAGQESPWGATNIFPETLLIEAAAQAAILFYRLNNGESLASSSRIFLGQAKAEFARPAHAGDQLVLKTLSGKMIKTGGYMDVRASVQEEKIADVQIFYSLRPSSDSRFQPRYPSTFDEHE